jgi:hypothetical protein
MSNELNTCFHRRARQVDQVKKWGDYYCLDCGQSWVGNIKAKNAPQWVKRLNGKTTNDN